MKIIKTTKLRTVSILLAITTQAPSFALNVIMPIEDDTQSILQASVSVKTAHRWSVDSYHGSSLELVDDIREQAVSNELPNAAQIPGATIRRWARLGFINGIEAQSERFNWKDSLPKEVISNISFQDVTYAVPTQIHRSNWMWTNRERMNQFSEHKNIAPQNWESFIELGRRYRSDGMPFLLTVDDPAQNTLIFESLLLGIKGGEFYNRVFKDFDTASIKSQDMVEVFEHLALLRPAIRENRYPSWDSAIKALLKGDGVVMFAGDWIKPKMLNIDGSLPDQISCNPPPQAAATFLYNLNSVVFFRQTERLASASLTNILFTESMQTELNLQEGSIPARLDISPTGFDRCGVRSMREFRSAAKTNTLRPSIAAGMAVNELVQKSVFEVIDNFIDDWEMSPEDGANQLSKAIRLALYRI